ncbi:MAG: helix-turn-helix transcriptional regulator [Candidatus Peribacteraceae bacterium]|nr:helix-turn-helix transcriptional regulator [Candidatus Peribacteraceae bacterium]
MSTIGERVREIRTNLGLNQSDFAHRLGMQKPSTVSKYEKDQFTNKVIDHYIKIAEMGKVNLNWLLTGKGPMEISSGHPSDIKDFNYETTVNEQTIEVIIEGTTEDPYTYDLFGIKLGATKTEVENIFDLGAMVEDLKTLHPDKDTERLRAMLCFDKTFLTRFYPIQWPEKYRPGPTIFFTVEYDTNNKVCRINLYYEIPMDPLRSEGLRNALINKLPAKHISSCEVDVLGNIKKCFKATIEDSEIVEASINKYTEEYSDLI